MTNKYKVSLSFLHKMKGRILIAKRERKNTDNRERERERNVMGKIRSRFNFQTLVFVLSLIRDLKNCYLMIDTS